MDIHGAFTRQQTSLPWLRFGIGCAAVRELPGGGTNPSCGRQVYFRLNQIEGSLGGVL